MIICGICWDQEKSDDIFKKHLIRINVTICQRICLSVQSEADKHKLCSKSNIYI